MKALIAAAIAGIGAAGVFSQSQEAPRMPPARTTQARNGARDWDAKAAAAYLDGRAAWWMTWPNAARDRGTFCVSCHTAVPYALARPALRPALGERGPSGVETRLVENVSRRVTLWNEVAPFYPDQLRGIPKTSESRGTEAVLNALILASRDAESGRLSNDTRAAFANMWALQMRAQDLSGAWAWLNFRYEPWESPDAPYFGASLAALAIGVAPEGYAAGPDAREGLKLLSAYFQREYDRQPLFNRLMVLWASTRVDGLLASSERQAIIDAAVGKQQDDGGWSTASLGAWKRVDGSALDVRSDGYATGLVTLVLNRAGMSSSAPSISRGRDWLRRNQDAATGRWPASSLNKERDPATDAGRFMSDAATAFAVMSLTSIE
jgi:squalene-hopene/tetraprenyl-beta-curcumene cyclase